jgi:Effector-associated domain 2/Tetratricopeptide repeat/vWA-MoxR associated protein middle region 0/NB-ARC domain
VNQSMPRQDPAAELRARLVDALVDIPFMAALADRRLLVSLIRRDLNNFPEVAEHPAARLHVVEVVVHCLAHAGGLRALLAALKMMAPDAPGVERAIDLIGTATVVSLLPDGEAGRVRNLLRRVEAGSSAEPVREGVIQRFRPPADIEGLVAIFDHYAEERCAPAVVPTVVLVVEDVAELCDDPELGTELTRWADQAAARHEADADLRGHRKRRTASDNPPDEVQDTVDGRPIVVDEEEEADLRSDAAQLLLFGSLDGPADTQGEMMPPVATSTGRMSGLPLVWGDVPQRNPSFTGREDLLALLHEELTRSRQTAVLPQALHGMGGVGKSQVAIEYVHRHSSEYDLIWWIPAEQPNQILDSLTRLAERLDLGAGPEANVAVPMVREALSTGGLPYERWLLVFDNAEAPDELQRYFPTGGAGKILVTSRDMDWARVTRVLEVDVFERPESIDFLRNRNPDLTRDEADRLAEALGDLPVAVEQAAAWRAATGMPVDEYLELLESKRIELLDASPSPDYRKSVAAAWQVSLDKLHDINPGALQLLQVCSFLAPEPINRALFAGSPTAPITPELDALLSDTFKLSRAIRDVQRYALARIDHRTNTLQIHRLIQAVLIASLDESDEATLRRGAHTLLANGNPNNPDSRADWPRYQALLPHVLVSNAVESPDPRVHELVFGVAQFLYYWGDHQGGQDLVQRAFECRVVDRGESDPHTLTVGKWLGWMRWVNGEYAVARELDERLLEIYRTEYGNEDEGTFDAMSVVSNDLRASGELTASRDLSELAYTTSRRVFGDDDPTTLICAHNLGVALRWTGEFGRAAELDQATYTRSALVFGPASARTLNTLDTLTVDLLQLGRYIDGSRQEEDVYRQHVEAFGVENPNTLRAALTLAVARRKAGDHEGALVLSREAFEKYSRRYGDVYPMTLAAAVNHSVDLRHAGDMGRALSICEGTIAAYEGMFGLRHSLTLSARTNSAVVLRLQGDSEAAFSRDMQTLKLLTEVLGPDHPTTLTCATNLASDLAALGRTQEAYEQDTDTLVRSERVLGVEHPSTLACGVNLALDLRALGRDAEADRIQTDAMTRMRHVLGDRHPATLNALQSIRADCDVDPMLL